MNLGCVNYEREVLRPPNAVLDASATREAVGSLAATVTKRKQPYVRGGCKQYTSNTGKFYEKWLRRKQSLPTTAMRTSVRRTAASSQTTSGTTRTTSSSQCTTSTPMTTFTPTIAWCTSCVELAHGAHCFTPDDDTAHLMAQVLSPFIVIHGHTHGAFSLTRSLPSSFTLPSCPSPSTSSIPSCSLSSTTRLSWQVCATPPQMRVRTP